jgi:hypothetical protein
VGERKGERHGGFWCRGRRGGVAGVGRMDGSSRAGARRCARHGWFGQWPGQRRSSRKKRRGEAYGWGPRGGERGWGGGWASWAVWLGFTTTLVTFCDIVFMSPNLKFMSLFKIYDISMMKTTSSPIMRGIA